MGCALECVYTISSQWPGWSMAGRQAGRFRWTSANGKAWCFLGSNIHGHMVGPDVSMLAPTSAALPTLRQQWPAFWVTPSRGKECVLNFQVSKLVLETQDKVKVWTKSFLGLRLRMEYQKSHLWIARMRCWAVKTRPHLPLAPCH